MPTKNANLQAVGGSGITATMKFVEGSTNITITGTAAGLPQPTTAYVSLAYGVNSNANVNGPNPCRDDGTLGAVLLDPNNILNLLGNPLLASVAAALSAALGPFSPVNNPPPGGVMFSPMATARMFLGVWSMGAADPNNPGKFLANFGPVVKPRTGPNGIKLSQVATVSIRQPQFPLLPNPVTDARPQIFQLRACGAIV